MRPSQTLSHLVLLLLLASSSASVLEETCRFFATGGYDYGTCIRFFQASKDSATADKRDLAVIAMGISRATSVNTGKRIAALKAGDKDEKIQNALATCDQLYSGAVNRFDEAAQGIASGKLQDALTSLGYALDVPGNCEEQFRESGVQSPLGAENSEFAKECAIALAVTRLVYVTPMGRPMSTSERWLYPARG